MDTSLVTRLGAACERYGPGRLPGADDRVLGAGYACASTAIVAILVFAGLGGLLGLLGGGGVGGGLAFLGVVAAPLVVPAAFALGVATWWVLPEDLPLFGPVAGLLTTLLVYPVGGAVVAVLLYVQPSLGSLAPGADRLAASLGGGVLVGFVALVFTFWVTLPVGTAGGYVYERARRERTP